MKMTSKKILQALLLSTLMMSCLSIAAVYQWKDANGKIHFSDKPHKNANEITINTAKPSGLGTTNQQLKRQKERLLQYQNDRSKKNTIKRKAKVRDDQITQRCQRLKNIIINYEEVDYIFTRDESNKKTRLSSAQKKQEIATLKQQYENKCDG